jgi:hypothetical protein
MGLVWDCEITRYNWKYLVLNHPKKCDLFDPKKIFWHDQIYRCQGPSKLMDPAVPSEGVYDWGMKYRGVKYLLRKYLGFLKSWLIPKSP